MKILQKNFIKRKLKSETAQWIGNGREADWQITIPATWSLVPGPWPRTCRLQRDA